VASIPPVETSPRKKLLKELKEMAKTLPRLDEEADRFGHDLKEILKHQPSLPKENNRVKLKLPGYGVRINGF